MEWLKSLIIKCQKMAQETFIALLARISLAATFWLSGQSKVEGLNIDILGGTPPKIGIPHITNNTLALFATEYQLPVLPPQTAAVMAASAEHIFPLLLLAGLATRFSALALFVMTMVIQIFVYPDAWPVHISWITSQLYLMVNGGGKMSVDAILHRRYCR